MKNEQLKGVLEKIKTGVGKVSKRALIIALVLIIAVAAAISIYLNTRPYSLLFTQLSPSEASSVASKLEEWGVRDYKWENNDTILVPEKNVNSLMARFIREGYPSEGFSYSTYYDNVSALSTEAERNQAWLITVQDRMAAVLSNLEGVRGADVFFTPGQDLSYVLDSGNIVNASASVILYLDSDKKISTQMATQIRAFVAHSIQGLTVENVSLTDNHGNPYTASGDTESVDFNASQLKLQLEEENNNKIRTQVKNPLDGLYGEENVRVSVNTVVDLTNTVIDDHDVHLPEYALDGSTNGAGIIGSRVYSYETREGVDTTYGGTVGTTTNSDLPTVVEQEPAPEQVQDRTGGSGQLDYDNSTTDTHIIRTTGVLTDCTVGVSINRNVVENFDENQIRRLVASSAGLTAVETDTMTADEYLASKITVVCEPFYDPTPSLPDVTQPEGFQLETWMIIAAAAGLLLFVLIIVLALVLSGRKKRAEKKQQKELEEQEQQVVAVEEIPGGELGDLIGVPELEPVGGADVMSLQTERSMELRKEIRQFAEENPEVAAQLLKAWLRGGDDNG